jgi:hypothetical protein
MIGPAKLQCLLETITIAYTLLPCGREAKLDLPLQIAMSCWTQSYGLYELSILLSVCALRDSIDDLLFKGCTCPKGSE